MTYRFSRAVDRGEVFENIPRVFLYGSRSLVDCWEFSRAEKFEKARLVEGSDWDYAIQYSPEAVKELVEKGWKMVDVEAYQDASTEQVFENGFEGEKIQISLRKNIRAFRDLWCSIPPRFYWDRINKKSPLALDKKEIQDYMSQLYHLVSGFYTPKIRGEAIGDYGVEDAIAAQADVMQRPVRRVQPINFADLPLERAVEVDGV